MHRTNCSLLAFALGAYHGALGTIVTNDTGVAAGKTFDYIVAGAGLSGLTVGNKLSSKGHSVLIIEAGPDASWNPVVFNAEERPFQSSVCNWQYPARGEDGEPLAWSIDSGACIGGSTSINGMVWYRPSRAEIDQLETLGNPGWNWESLEKHMLAAERNIPPDATQLAQGAGVEPLVHGHHGFINTSFPTPMRVPGLVARFKEAVPAVFPGVTVGNDLSNRALVSSAATMYTIWYDPATGKIRRSSAADGLLWAPDQQRPTLTVLATHKVDRVLFGRHATATGVAFVPSNGTVPSKGGFFKAYAAKGVILSAGALASAPILERSGIGRPDVLRAAGIDIVADLPGVGSNLNDQPGTATYALVSQTFQNDTSVIDNRNLFGPEISLIGIKELFGSLSSSHASGLLSPESLSKRAQALVDAKAAVNMAGAEAILNATIDLITTHQLPVAELLADSGGTTLFSAFWPLVPLSRGHVHIASPNPLEHPVITPRLLTDDFDAAVAVAIARASRQVFTSAPLRNIVADAYYNPSDIGANSTDEAYLAWYRNTSFGASHWIGSTAMLPRGLGGVVDDRLRVYSTENLHVVDAGILPFQLTSHMMSTLYAVAGRAADVILGCVGD